MAKVAHLKGPEKEGNREPVYFATHADYVEGLDDKLDTIREIAEQTARKTQLDNSLVLAVRQRDMALNLVRRNNFSRLEYIGLEQKVVDLLSLKTLAG